MRAGAVSILLTATSAAHSTQQAQTTVLPCVTE